MSRRIYLLSAALFLPACTASKDYHPVTVNTPGGPTVVMVGTDEPPPPPRKEYDAQGQPVAPNPAPVQQYDAKGNAIPPPPAPVHYDVAGKPLPPPAPVAPAYNKPVTIHNPFSGTTTVELRESGSPASQP